MATTRNLTATTALEVKALKSFIRWIQESLANGSMLWNQSEAMVHFVNEGLLLRPAIFNEFEKYHGQDGLGNTIDPAYAPGEFIKSCVSYSSWALPAQTDKSIGYNMHCYRVVSSKGETKTVITGIVLTKPQRWFSEVQVNPFLCRIEGPVTVSGKFDMSISSRMMDMMKAQGRSDQYLVINV